MTYTNPKTPKPRKKFKVEIFNVNFLIYFNIQTGNSLVVIFFIIIIIFIFFSFPMESLFPLVFLLLFSFFFFFFFQVFFRWFLIFKLRLFWISELLQFKKLLLHIIFVKFTNVLVNWDPTFIPDHNS